MGYVQPQCEHDAWHDVRACHGIAKSVTGRAFHSDSNALASETEHQSRSMTFVVTWALIALLAFSGLIALGVWQLQRLDWKQNLIERVNQRVEAPASAAPGPGYPPPPGR